MRVLLFLVLIIPTGCNGRQVDFVVYRDIPDVPSFTVMPRNLRDSTDDVEYARKIERMIIKSGAKVLAPPPARDLRVRTGKLDAAGEASVHKDDRETDVTASANASDRIVTEDYTDIRSYKSTFVMYVDGSGDSSLRVLRVESGEVVAITELSTYRSTLMSGQQDEDEEKVLRGLLSSLGVNVKPISPKP